MNRMFYFKRLLYAFPFYLVNITFVLFITHETFKSAQNVHFQSFIFWSAAVAFMVLWLISPFTFLFLESFRFFKIKMKLNKMPLPDFPDEIPEVIKIIVTKMMLVPHYFLEGVNYIMNSFIVSYISVFLSPLVIFVLVFEKLFNVTKNLFFTKGRK